MSGTDYDIEGLELSGDSFTVVQSLIRNWYTAYDEAGEPVLKGKQKLFKLKEQFPFTDGAGEDVFTVTASGIVDVAGNYVLRDSRTEEPVVVLDNDFSLFRDTWRLRDPDSGAVLAKIRSRGALVTLARAYLPLGWLIPHKYEITGPDGAHVGSIHGKLSVRDTYVVTVDDASPVPREATLAAAMVIDAIQNH